MSQRHVELIRKGYEAWNKGDPKWVLDHMDPGVEWVAAAENPDHATYLGFEEVSQFWSEWRSTLGQLRFQVEELIDEGNSVVAVTCRIGRGEQSGAEVADQIVQVFTFGPDDKCVRVQEYFSKQAALEAAERERTG